MMVQPWKNCDNETLLVLDLHKAQKSDHIIYVFKKCVIITPVFVQSIIQPLDVCYSAPYLKKKVEDASICKITSKNIFMGSLTLDYSLG